MRAFGPGALDSCRDPRPTRAQTCAPKDWHRRSRSRSSIQRARTAPRCGLALARPALGAPAAVAGAGSRGRCRAAGARCGSRGAAAGAAAAPACRLRRRRRWRGRRRRGAAVRAGAVRPAASSSRITEPSETLSPCLTLTSRDSPGRGRRHVHGRFFRLERDQRRFFVDLLAVLDQHVDDADVLESADIRDYLDGFPRWLPCHDAVPKPSAGLGFSGSMPKVCIALATVCLSILPSSASALSAAITT